jgi:hypothetical protein
VPLNNAGIMKLAKFTDSEARGPISSPVSVLQWARRGVRGHSVCGVIRMKKILALLFKA